MKVLFINPPHSQKGKLIRNISCSYESKGNYLFQPQDFLLLSSAFSKVEHDLKLFDFIAHPTEENTTWLRIKAEQADLIILIMADCLWSEDLSFLRKLRKNFTRTIWIAGDALLEKESRDEATGLADAYIPHPFFLKINTPLHTSLGILDLVQSPTYGDENVLIDLIPHHEPFLNKSYRWPFARHKIYSSVFTTWGCPYRCQYCINGNFPFHRRSLESLKKELHELKRLGIKEIYIGDRSFGFPQEGAISFLKMMIEEKFNFSWSCYFHPHHSNDELLNLMKKAGCHTLIVGIEDQNQEKLKSYARYVAPKKLEELFSLAKRLKLDICGDFLFGLPHQSTSDIENLIKYSKKLPLSYASFNLLAPLPGTQLRQDLKKEGLDLRNFDSLGRTQVFTLGKVSEKELKNLRNKATTTFYLRPSYLLRRLCSIKSLEHFSIQVEEMLMLFKKVFIK